MARDGGAHPLKIVSVVGARPNFVKIAPILRAFEAARRRGEPVDVTLVHTGQHYDRSLSDAFFADLEIRPPDVNLGVGSGSHAEQTARVLAAVEPVLIESRPDLLMVVGDVNSTLASALAASKLLIPVAHVEAGLRSGDRTMPEEINRILTDAISDLCFTTCEEANRHLAREGVGSEKIFFVGNVMIDSLLRHRPHARAPEIVQRLSMTPRSYALMTVHRPANVDRYEDAVEFLDVVEPVQRRLPVVLPVHPRTRAMLERHALGERLRSMTGLHLVEPLGYSEFLYVMDRARLVLTDSGGVQEETTVLGVPCLTLRDNTERAITIDEGTNRLTGMRPEAVVKAVDEILANGLSSHRVPPLWDGHAAERIVEVVLRRAAPRA
jgi:UDP-N-acetylglucosamine 2-epimerase (non-hydrolysing)